MKDNNIDRIFREKVEQMTGLPENVSWNEDAGWEQYNKQFHSKKSQAVNIALGLLSIAAVSVIVLLVMVPGIFSKNQTVIVQNETNEVRQIALPDGNMVWLNKNSSVEYASGVNSEDFVIQVKGEIYIEIKNIKSRQYILKAFNAIVVAEKVSNVDIKAYPDKENIDIVVSEGTIKVLEEGSPNGLALLATEGNYCSVNKSQKLIYASSITNENYLAWKTGRLVFEDQSMATVTDVLSEYYNRPIEISDKSIAYCMFSGSFEKPTLVKILNKIQTDLNLEIRNTGTKITISGIGCL